MATKKDKSKKGMGSGLYRGAFSGGLGKKRKGSMDEAIDAMTNDSAKQKRVK